MDTGICQNADNVNAEQPTVQPAKNISQEEYDEIMALPVLSENLPLTFGNGSVLSTIGFACPSCGAPTSEVRVNVSSHQESISMKGFVVCRSCHVINPLSVRIRDDGTLLYAVNGVWRNTRYASHFRNLGGIMSKWLPVAIAAIIIAVWIFN